MTGRSKAQPQLHEPQGDASDYSTDDSESGATGAAAKGKMKQSGAPKKDQVRRRSSKACDNCRKSKTKCARNPDPVTNEMTGPCQNCIDNGQECTSLGASRKRGPPKGYIDLIEGRLHRLESLLGGLLQNEDPRAAALLGELIGSAEAREILTNDLRAASALGPDGKPKKSWQRPPLLSEVPSRSGSSTEFPSHKLISPPPLPPPFLSRSPDHRRASTSSQSWFPDDGFNPSSGAGLFSSGVGMPPVFFDDAGPRVSQREAHDSDGDSSRRSNVEGVSPPALFGTNRSGGSNSGSGMDIPTAYGVHPRASNNLTALADVAASNAVNSPRQRRKLDLQTPTLLNGSGSSSAPNTLSIFQGTTKAGMATNVINHTGQATYTLSPGAATDVHPPEDGLSELADVVGQLSLNENAEVRYHGRSSGLYLISKSARFQEFFWRFPSAGVWPPSDVRVPTAEDEILKVTGTENSLPDMATQQHLLDLYFTYVHPHFPILYKVSFLRQYRHGQSNPESTEPSTPAGGGKVPVVLLLAMFALAARYSNLHPPVSSDKYWTAGQEYLDKAKRLLFFDVTSSKLVSVQVLLLLAYREIGTGAMSASWLFTGMAIRMAQDLGLFRDIEKWFLPVQRFSHEEKQTRKRVWWGCTILDRYTSSYIGRPGTIHERDTDVGFPSEEEPDEHEQWRPIRTDGTQWTSPPKTATGIEADGVGGGLARYPPIKSYTISCFNAAGALAVIINRIIANIYAISIRVLGQSSETLLSLLDQSLASWYLALPPHLCFNPNVKPKVVPPPHILSLHLQFYSALILLHRPFIPGQNSQSSPSHFPSHSICTTSAASIAKIVTIFSKTFTLRQCPPFLTYPIFSAAILCVYNTGFDEGLAMPAKIHLAQCLNALKEMEASGISSRLMRPHAARQGELLIGLVDMRGSLGTDLDEMEVGQLRHLKRPVEEEDAYGSSVLDPNLFAGLQPANFHARPLGRQPSRGKSAPRSRKSFSSNSSSQSRPPAQASEPVPQPLPNHPYALPPPMVQQSEHQPQHHHERPPVEGLFNHSVPAPGSGYHTPSHNTYDLLAASDLSQFRSPPGTSGQATTNFAELLDAFLRPTEAARDQMYSQHQQQGANMDTGAFYGFPDSVGMDQEWASYIPNAFFSPAHDSPIPVDEPSESQRLHPIRPPPGPQQ